MVEVDKSLRLLIYAKSSEVSGEIREACRRALHAAPVTFLASDLTRLVDMARDREPRAALIELSGNIEEDRALVRELKAVAPQTVIVGVYDTQSSGELDGADAASRLVELVRLGVNDFLRRPLAGGELRQLFERMTLQSDGRAQLGTCIPFISNKGGVGKSTLSINTATRLAMKYPGEVLLIDASLQMGVCAPMLNLHPETSLLDAVRQRERIDGTLIRQLCVPHSSGLLLLAAPPDAIAATEVDDQMFTRLLNLARRTFRYVIVDTFPVFDQTVMSILDVASLAYVVVDNVVPTVVSAVQLMRLLEQLHFPEDRLRIVLNRYQRVLGNPSPDEVARVLQAEVSHLLPYDKRAITAANLGRPYAMDYFRWSKLHRALSGLVAEIESTEAASAAAIDRGALHRAEAAKPAPRPSLDDPAEGDLFDYESVSLVEQG